MKRGLFSLVAGMLVAMGAGCSTAASGTQTERSREALCDDSVEPIDGKVWPRAASALSDQPTALFVIMKLDLSQASTADSGSLTDEQKMAGWQADENAATASQACARAAAQTLGVGFVGPAVIVPNLFEVHVTRDQANALAARVDVDHLDVVSVADPL